MEEELWNAIVNCDERYDGAFVYGVLSTGIFCRPSCKSRTPNRRNVRVLTDALQATEQGLRPCKRCRPDLLGAYSAVKVLVDGAVKMISTQFMEDLTLEQLAKQMYVSPFHLQRSFKQIMGISPFGYVTQKRIGAAKHLLVSTDERVTAIALHVGFKNPSHFSVVFGKQVGVSPTEFRLLHTSKSNTHTLAIREETPSK